MYFTIFIILIGLIILLIVTFLTVFLLRYFIKKNIANNDYKTNGSYIISDDCSYFIINNISLDIWYVENINNNNDWIEYKQKLPHFYTPIKLNNHFKYVNLFNSPKSTKILSENINDKKCVYIANILTFKYNIKKKNISIILYFSGEFNYYSEQEKLDYLLFSSNPKSNELNECSLIKINSKRECIQINYNLDTKEYNLHDMNRYQEENYIYDQIDASIPLHNLWKMLIILSILVISISINYHNKV